MKKTIRNWKLITVFFHTIFGFSPQINFYTNGSYKSDNKFCLTTIDQTNLNYECNTGSMVNGPRHPVLLSFVPNERLEHKTIERPKIQQVEKVTKNFSNNIKFHVGDDYNNVVDLRGETMTSTVFLKSKNTKLFFHEHG